MGINMDIRNEPEYAFLDLDDLDDREKNEIRAILRPTTGVDIQKLPWDIGEKEYELNTEVVEEQVEDVSTEWQHCGMAESITSYDGCGVTTSPIMTTIPPGHHYAGHQMMVYNEIPSIPGNLYANNATGDPNYPFVQRLQYGPPPMYSSDSELMNPVPSRDNERRRGRGGRSSGGGGGGNNKDSYNPGSDMQKVMLPPNYAQFHYNPQRPSDSPHVLPMYPSSGTIYSVSPHAHSAAGIRIYLPPQNPYPSQNPQMYRHNHPSYGHHPSTYQPESQMNTKYIRGSQGQATYYNQDSQKSMSQKHHETRVLQRDNGPTSMPPFRHGSNNSEIDTTKKNHGKSISTNANSSSSDTRDATDTSYTVHNNNATGYLSNNKNVTLPFRHGTSEVDTTKKNHGKSPSPNVNTTGSVADTKDIAVHNNDATSYLGADKKTTPPFRHGSSNAEVDTTKKNHGKSLSMVVNTSGTIADRRDVSDTRDSVHNNNITTYLGNDKKVAPPFRQGSSNSEIDTTKKNQGKSLSQIVNTNASVIDTKDNSVHNNNTTKQSDINKKVTFSIDHSKIESNDAATIKEDHSEKTTVQKKETLPVVAINNNTVTASSTLKDKVSRDKDIASPAEEKIEKIQVETQHQPRTSAKVAENVEQNDSKNESKNTQEGPIAVKTPETPAATLPTNAPSSVSVAPLPPPSVSWANVLKKGGSPMDSMRSTPPITKLPVARVTPISLPPPPSVESVPLTPKTSSQDVTRNETVASTANRNNNTETTPKAPEVSPWAETKNSTGNIQQNNLNDPAVFRMGEHLLKYQMDKQTVSLLPRGLTNRSNYCYINSILQALLACPPFYNLLMDLPYRRNTTKNSSTPLIDNMVRFVREFNPLTEGARVQRKDRSQKRGEETAADVQCGIAFEPSYVYTMLKNTSCAGVFSVEGRQEDAEEFLSCLLNGISDEMLELMKLVNSESNDTVSNETETNVNFNNVEEEWKVMGPKNKGSITRCTEFGRTPLSDIFRGQLRSRVLRTGEDATDNVQPFFTLQLDIEKAESVEEALETLVGRDLVEGMTCSKTKQQIEAWKQVTLEELPVILILHLKWFDYKMDGCSKIFKRVGFPIDLKLDSKLLSPNVAKKLLRKQKQYKLFAVTYHDGKEASKGHYVTDAFHVGYGSWVRYDDSSVKGIYEVDVLNPTPPRVPYLLYYRRSDTIGNNQPNTPRTR